MPEKVKKSVVFLKNWGSFSKKGVNAVKGTPKCEFKDLLREGFIERIGPRVAIGGVRFWVLSKSDVYCKFVGWVIRSRCTNFRKMRHEVPVAELEKQTRGLD